MQVRNAILLLLFIAGPFATADEPTGELAQRLAAVKFEQYAEAPGYSEGPTWRNGEVFFCSGALLRVDPQRKVHKYLEIGPAGTLLRVDGQLLICDNKHKALLNRENTISLTDACLRARQSADEKRVVTFG